MPDRYRITIQGTLTEHWSAWFEGMEIINMSNGRSVLIGLMADQVALHHVLVKIRDLGLPLIAIEYDPSLNPPELNR